MFFKTVDMTCQVCLKKIGHYELVGTPMNSPLGAIPLYDSKPDYHKASHIYFPQGLICKGCARKLFPAGIAYRVLFAPFGKEMADSGVGGVRRSGYYASREEAQERASKLPCGRVEEVKL